MPSHSSILAYKIPWTEEPGGVQSMMGLQRVRHDWAHTVFLHCVLLFSEYFGYPWILHIHLYFINSHKKLIAVSINIVLNLFSYFGRELTFLLYKVVHYLFSFWYWLSTSFQYISLSLVFKQFHKFKQMIDLCLDNIGRILHISEGCK